MAEPTAEQIRDARLYRQLGLNDEEYARVVDTLGRHPNYVEAGLFGVLWSEHCSYKSSRVYLKRFPTQGPQVLQGPGENAGVVDIGDGFGIAFKMESHNHPSAVEPYQGAATGVGGILRDVFTMGARPIAFLDSLRFGPLEDAHTRYLFSHVVAGIGGYGNCTGIPTVGGEVVFDPSYTHNPLVNAMCVGVLPASRIVKGIASGVGNPVFVVGSRTGRDGIHGATFASVEDPHTKERSAVQVGDPFLGKLLMEACLELMDTGAVVGIQDMGAAGLTSSSAEMASRAGGGLEMYLDQVPVREEGMTPYEMMLSESQERMLVVMEKGKEQVAFDILHKWGLQVAEIGKVTDDGQLRLFFHGEVVADVPVKALVDEAPVYERPVKAPGNQPGTVIGNQPGTGDTTGQQTGATMAGSTGATGADVSQATLTAADLVDVDQANINLNLADAVMQVVSHPSVADKRWVYQQYDYSVRASTQVGPGSDAAIVRVPGSTRGVAMTTDGNGRYVYLNPRRGGAIAVAEAARNIIVSGGKPLAITDCLNFGNPENPEIMYQFAEAVEGMSEACLALDTPVVSGNVSFYNQSRGEDIFPTPVVGGVGVVEDLQHVTAGGFVESGSAILLLGHEDTALDGALYAQMLAGRPVGDAPRFDLDAEAKLQKTVYNLIRQSNIRAAHDVSEGGLVVALAEMCIAGGMGARVDLGGQSYQGADRVGWLFSEAQGRILVEVAASRIEQVLAYAKESGVPTRVLGLTGGDEVSVGDAESEWLRLPLSSIRDAYTNAIPELMQRAVLQTDEA